MHPAASFAVPGLANRFQLIASGIRASRWPHRCALIFLNAESRVWSLESELSSRKPGRPDITQCLPAAVPPPSTFRVARRNSDTLILCASAALQNNLP